jgi:phosphate transport system protein
MLQKYEEQLDTLKNSIDILGAKIIQAVDVCEEGLTSLNIQKFDECRNILINTEYEANEIDQKIVTILALFEPEAVELRELVAYLKTTNELVKINDNLKSFAKRVKSHIQSDIDMKQFEEYSLHLANSAFKAITFSIEAMSVSTQDDAQDLFRKACVEESKNDDLYSLLEKNIMANLCKEIEKSAECIEVLSTMRKLERMADRAVNITKLMLFARVGGEIKQFG